MIKPYMLKYLAKRTANVAYFKAIIKRRAADKESLSRNYWHIL